jgi:uncharacterized oligopeptide transporter (OPT) family protein
VGKVRRSAYRQPVTPNGLRKIESGELRWFDVEVFSNLNTGVLEQYLDEKNRQEGFNRSRFIWRKIALGLVIGSAFAFINFYIGLKVGLTSAGALYISYLIGLALKWSPNDINVTYSCATGADRTSTGFIYTFPAIFLLAYSTQYMGYQGSRLVQPEMIYELLPIVLVATMLAAFLGVIYFIIFRRIWLVEDPLPTPGFESVVKLLDIAKDVQRGNVEQARRSIRLVGFWTAIIAFLSFIRDFPIFGPRENRVPLIDYLVKSTYYRNGVIQMTPEQSVYTHVSYAFFGFTFAFGWFMRSRMALLITIGSLFTWFVVVPMVVIFDVPIYVALIDGFVAPHDFPAVVIFEGSPIFLLRAPSPAFAADIGIGKLMAIGAILGGGVTALIKMFPTFKSVTQDIRKSSIKNKKIKDWVPHKGWYEWPVTHIKPMMIIATVGIGLIFSLGGFPILQSFVFAGLLVIITFVLGAIAVKVGGEVGSPPVSGTSVLCLLLLILIFSGLNVISPFRSQSQLVIMALIGTTVFGSAISLSSDVIWDFKVALYAGTRPYHIMKGELTGIFFGTFVSVIAAIFFSTILAKNIIDFKAPQAHAFAIFTQILMGGKIMYSVFIMGIIIGVFIELLTGLGTAFGLGMYLPLAYTLPFLVGGISRDTWQKKVLESRAKAQNWPERKKTFRVMDSYMRATALFIGEAIIGVILSLYYFFS